MRYPDPPPRPELAALQHKEALALVEDLHQLREDMAAGQTDEIEE